MPESSPEEAELAEELGDVTAEASFSLEHDLEQALVVNLKPLESGLQLYADGPSGGQQVNTAQVGRIDLLCKDANGDLVVVELKVGKASDRVCRQILRYMGWVAENLADGRQVRGIIVAGDFSDGVRQASKFMRGVELVTYRFNFQFERL